MVEVDSVPEWAQGVLIGVNLDLRKLSFILGFLPSEDVFLWNTTKAQDVKSIGFECGPWRGCLAGVTGSASGCTNVFKEKKDDAAFNLMMDLESE